jgi:hypothetical protein
MTRDTLGRSVLAFTGWVLAGSGLFALYLAFTTTLLPHDVAYLGFTVDHLCGHYNCQIVRFLAHDRAAFGGSIISIGVLYHWLATSPLRRGESWAWWTFVASGLCGFASFLTYLGYGYLDTWHGWATIALLPFFTTGLGLAAPREIRLGWHRVWRSGTSARLRAGAALLALTGMGMMAAGITIMIVGMTTVFVPQDLQFMGTVPADLHALSERLIPLIAHDRSGFGGGLFSGGIAILFIALCGVRQGDRRLWWTLAAAGGIGFGCAIGMHFIVGYTSFIHLLPAYAGAAMFAASAVILFPEMAATTQRMRVSLVSK